MVLYFLYFSCTSSSIEGTLRSATARLLEGNDHCGHKGEVTVAPLHVNNWFEAKSSDNHLDFLKAASLHVEKPNYDKTELTTVHESRLIINSHFSSP